jgi:hypothetical protein
LEPACVGPLTFSPTSCLALDNQYGFSKLQFSCLKNGAQDGWKDCVLTHSSMWTSPSFLHPCYCFFCDSSSLPLHPAGGSGSMCTACHVMIKHNISLGPHLSHTWGTKAECPLHLLDWVVLSPMAMLTNHHDPFHFSSLCSRPRSLAQEGTLRLQKTCCCSANH